MRSGVWVVTLAASALLAGCGLLATAPAEGPPASAAPTGGVAPISAAPVPPAASPSARPPASTSDPSLAEPTLAEPTTTDTLPPPPQVTTPAAKRSGRLTARSLPVPRGWRTAVLPGGAEDGYQGNGSWVHGRDPRYAAYETIAVGCAAVTRDDYPDPVAALEGTYERGGRPGVGLVAEFATEAHAARFYALYRDQVAACTDPDGPFTARVDDRPLGLVDRRDYADGRWTEVVRRDGRRITLIALTDTGRGMTLIEADELLATIRDRSGR